MPPSLPFIPRSASEPDQGITHPHGLSKQGEGAGFWAYVDLSLLILTVAASSDMLIQLGSLPSLTWLLCYGIALLRIAMLWPLIFKDFLANKIIFAYPLACLASVLWSMDPKTSLVAAIQLSMTFVIAFFLGWRYSLTVITKMIFGVLIVAVFLSLVHWATSVFPWPVFTRAGGLAGFFSHKNMLGERIVFCIVAILSILLMHRQEASPTFKKIAILALVLALVALILSQAMTSVLMTPLLAAGLFVLCFRQINPVVSGLIAGAAILCAALGPVLLAIAGIDPVDAVLNAVGKDATLTGRTLLWHVAQTVSAEHPFLGVGYSAFWSAPQFQNERLLTQHAGAITSVSFHNFVLEILVAAGWPALLAMLALLAEACRRLLKFYVLTRSPAAACGVILVIGSAIISLTGTTLYRQHEFMIIVLVMYAVSAQEDLGRVLKKA